MNNDAPQPQNSEPKYKSKYRIDSTRLPAWNYASDGGYFVTICTDGKKYFFGEVVEGEMQLSAIGEIAQKFWYEIPNNFSNCHIDAFCVMPNHIHGILIINQIQGDAIPKQEENAINRVSTKAGGERGGVTGLFNPMLSKNSLSKIVRWYKGRCKFEINQIYQGFGWQERFHDNIIRDKFALDRIRQYIINNPMNWERDREQPPHSPL
ncbi:transposase [Nostocaceae cyanobacterium CENA369]|uniref:Transposase n=1 Tax=Dendronalium phyllosphericum CENA369 TaxID=1725256 RepID=A0A8J7I806_9NOST|nr:transposase [Dendronalium phyllosphericum]MBH8577845.1 transposase [Dendronalium phyllosphericum CENA369]